jgi:DNA-binding response OmpR family regulator
MMPNQGTQTYTVLVVDDDPSILQLLEDVLQEAGYDLTCLTHARPALEALAARPFDVLVIDQWLPDGNGLQICEAARTRYGSDPVVMIITADARKERNVLSLQLCADDFIAKPFDIEELLARIEVRLRRAGHVRI